MVCSTLVLMDTNHFNKTSGFYFVPRSINNLLHRMFFCMVHIRGGQQVDWPVNHRVSVGRFCIEHKIPKTNTFQSVFQKYKNNIHQLVGHAYSLVPLVMADHRLARQMPGRCCNILIYFRIIVWQSLFRHNRHLASVVCRGGEWGAGRRHPQSKITKI